MTSNGWMALIITQSGATKYQKKKIVNFYHSLFANKSDEFFFEYILE